MAKIGRVYFQIIDLTEIVIKIRNRSKNIAHGPAFRKGSAKEEVSQEAAISEIVLNDDVSDGIEYKLDIVGVCGDSELSVDVLRVTAPIQSLKLLLDVTARIFVRTPTCYTTVQAGEDSSMKPLS